MEKTMAFLLRVLLLLQCVDFLIAVIISKSQPSDLLSGAFETSEGYIAHEWNYKQTKGPDTWPALYPECAGANQSPVAIVTSQAVTSPDLGPVELLGYRNKRLTMQAFNNGHTVKFKFKADTPVKRPVRFRNFRQKQPVDSYELAEIHLHWGQTEYEGSEHSLDGQYYPAEIHFVHKLTRLTLDQALLTPKGLAVLGAFFIIGQGDNPAYTPVISSLRNIKYKNETTTIKFTKTLRSLLPRDVTQFFRYDGSLTTPTCNEVVVWTVFRNPIWISARQMDAFRGVMKSYKNEPAAPMRNNYRPVQRVNSRQILKYGIHH